jgi:hypothetical protein
MMYAGDGLSLSIGAIAVWRENRKKSMAINPKVEEPTRKMIGHVIRQECDDLENEIRRIGNDALLSAMELCIVVAGYIAIDSVSRWPSDPELRGIAQHRAASARGFELSKDDVYGFLATAGRSGRAAEADLAVAAGPLARPARVAGVVAGTVPEAFRVIATV